MPANTVAVSRGTLFGNPYRATAYRLTAAPPSIPDARALAVRDFRAWLTATPEGAAVAERARRELRGKNLACWCRPGSPCHADALLELVNK